MTSMSFLNTSMLVHLNSVDVTVKALEEELIPSDDVDEAMALIHMLYSNHCGHI